MTEFLETTVDKFTFKVATGRLYTHNHLWIRLENNLVRVGLSDYLQQTSGDVAFAEVKAEGTELALGDELAIIETMKTNLSIPSPLEGVIKSANSGLLDEPELINQDPYGEGWLVEVEPTNWESDKADLLEVETYFEMMAAEAEKESKNL